jgi:hypothetical protein
MRASWLMRLGRQAVRVALAVDALVVVQADVEHGFRSAAAFGQHVVAALRVRAHQRELVLGQAARLVQHIQRHQRLAHVVQQAGESGLAAGLVVHAELARQRHHQRAHGH